MTAEDIRAKLEAAGAYLTEHPDEARYTDSVATARVVEGLRVRAEGPGGMVVETDMPESVGGANAAQSPGWLFRAALASCVATLIAMRAAQEEMDASGLVVEVDSESDDRGILGLDESTPAGPLSIRVRVSGASDDIRQVVEWAFEHCPVQDAAARAIPITLQLT
jgi:uncharacterized OsmC-like protein